MHWRAVCRSVRSAIWASLTHMHSAMLPIARHCCPIACAVLRYQILRAGNRVAGREPKACPDGHSVLASCRYIINSHFDGSLAKLWTDLISQEGIQGLYRLWPSLLSSQAQHAWMCFLLFGALQAALQLLVPGKQFHGPVTPMGNVPQYKARNSLSIHFVNFASSCTSTSACCCVARKARCRITALLRQPTSSCIMAASNDMSLPASQQQMAGRQHDSTGSQTFAGKWGAVLPHHCRTLSRWCQVRSTSCSIIVHTCAMKRTRDFTSMLVMLLLACVCQCASMLCRLLPAITAVC